MDNVFLEIYTQPVVAGLNGLTFSQEAINLLGAA
jgi:hypothetical protein